MRVVYAGPTIVQERVSHDPDVLGVVRGHPRRHELDMAILLLAGIPLCVREPFVMMTYHQLQLD